MLSPSPFSVSARSRKPAPFSEPAASPNTAPERVLPLLTSPVQVQPDWTGGRGFCEPNRPQFHLGPARVSPLPVSPARHGVQRPPLGLGRRRLPARPSADPLNPTSK